ncbi:MAG: TraR/DksA family transcriptional regulator [Bradymonadaceae bacterium]
MTERNVEDLSEEELEELRGKLIALKAELESDLIDARESARPAKLDQAAVGRLSRMAGMQQEQMAAAHKRRLEVRLQQTRAAIAAFERESYGYCNVCDEPISYRRLLARPESPICVSCQTLREG